MRRKKMPKVRLWTKTAIDCYTRGCICEGCFYKEFFKDSSCRCQMKSTVLELVRVLGIPEKVAINAYDMEQSL